MITVVYDPSHSVGIPDGTVISVAEAICTGTPEGESVTVGTGLVIDAIRVLVKTGKIRHDQIQFEYEGNILPIDKDGRMVIWPEGFNDMVTTLLCQL